jgi:hypothetical protein
MVHGSGGVLGGRCRRVWLGSRCDGQGVFFPHTLTGTGKTETVKDLGKALGVNCVVFNCGETCDVRFMVRGRLRARGCYRPAASLGVAVRSTRSAGGMCRRHAPRMRPSDRACSQGKFFSGVAQCSACWACLDEFNRIDVEVRGGGGVLRRRWRAALVCRASTSAAAPDAVQAARLRHTPYAGCLLRAGAVCCGAAAAHHSKRAAMWCGQGLV